ncbi:MAG: hypothetical protein J1F60_11320 [Oscillospiraceae bacterium]|nr:hypothetical protein [Oscillospiraceae bacterium]
MNSRKNNEKIIQILSEMEPIRDETEEEKRSREQMTQEAIKAAEEEAPLAFPKKVAGVICVALWGFSLVALMFGFGDLGVLLPFMLLSLGAVCGLNVPAFWKKGKIFDVVVAIAACAVCVMVAFGILFVGGNR